MLYDCYSVLFVPRILTPEYTALVTSQGPSITALHRIPQCIPSYPVPQLPKPPCWVSNGKPSITVRIRCPSVPLAPLACATRYTLIRQVWRKPSIVSALSCPFPPSRILADSGLTNDRLMQLCPLCPLVPLHASHMELQVTLYSKFRSNRRFTWRQRQCIIARSRQSCRPCVLSRCTAAGGVRARDP